MKRGDFLNVIFDCPYELAELVENETLSMLIRKLKLDHKEILYYLIVRGYSTDVIGQIRGQSGRNIRKIRATIIRKIQKGYHMIMEKNSESPV